MLRSFSFSSSFAGPLPSPADSSPVDATFPPSTSCRRNSRSLSCDSWNDLGLDRTRTGRIVKASSTRPSKKSSKDTLKDPPKDPVKAAKERRNRKTLTDTTLTKQERLKIRFGWKPFGKLNSHNARHNRLETNKHEIEEDFIDICWVYVAPKDGLSEQITRWREEKDRARADLAARCPSDSMAFRPDHFKRRKTRLWQALVHAVIQTGRIRAARLVRILRAGLSFRAEEAKRLKEQVQSLEDRLAELAVQRG